MALLGQKEEVASDELVESKGEVIQKQVFNLETKSLHYASATGNYTSDPGPKQISTALIDEIVLHLCRYGLRQFELLERSKYQESGIHTVVPPTMDQQEQLNSFVAAV